jgi:hypothetical protein
MSWWCRMVGDLGVAVGSGGVLLRLGVGVGESVGELFGLGLHFAEFVEDGEALVEDAAAGEREAVLREVADGHALDVGAQAVVEGLDAGEDLEQRGFARAVAADQPGALVGRDQPVDVFEEEFLAVAFAGSGELKHHPYFRTVAATCAPPLGFSPHRKNGGRPNVATATQIDGQTRRPPPWRQRSWVRWVAASALGLLLCLAFSAVYVSRNLEPVLRRSVIESLEARFHSPVELDRLDISLLNGVQVSGRGLRILRLTAPTETGVPTEIAPMLSVDSFSFRTSIHDLVLLRAHLAHVEVDGMELHVPPDRRELLPKPAGSNRLKVHLTVGEIHCARAKLVLETARPGREPLEFDIQDLVCAMPTAVA